MSQYQDPYQQQSQYPPQEQYSQYPPQGQYAPYPPQGQYAAPGQYGVPYQTGLNYASVGVRAAAIIIDAAIIGIVGGIIGGVLGAIIAGGGNQGAVGIVGFLDFLLGLAGFGYIVYMEAKQGATFGKKAMGLRVVHLDGTPISWQESVIRNLLRIVDGLFVYLVRAIIIWNSPLKQRLGDIVAKTVVIKTK